MNADPQPVLNIPVTPQYEAQPRMNVDPEPVPNNQVALQNKLQPFMEGKVTQDPDPAHIMQPAPVKDNNEPIQMMQSFESTPMKETITGQNSKHPGSVTNDTVPHDEQKFEKRVETKYPEEYDSNHNGLQNVQDRENA